MGSDTFWTVLVYFNKINKYIYTFLYVFFEPAQIGLSNDVWVVKIGPSNPRCDNCDWILRKGNVMVEQRTRQLASGYKHQRRNKGSAQLTTLVGKPKSHKVNIVTVAGISPSDGASFFLFVLCRCLSHLLITGFSKVFLIFKSKAAPENKIYLMVTENHYFYSTSL